MQDNKTSQAAAVLDQALAANPNYTEAILLRAELNIRTGHGQAAISGLEDLLKKNAGLSPAQFLLADAYRTAGRFDDAVNIFHEQIEVTPNAPEPYFFLGLTELQQNKTEEARKSFEKVLELSPDNVLAVEQLINADLEAKDFSAATHRVAGTIGETSRSRGLVYSGGPSPTCSRRMEGGRAGFTQSSRAGSELRSCL